MIRKILGSPYMVMAVVLLMNVGKAPAKLIIGDWVNSPTFTGDGSHNVTDIFEGLVVIFSIWFGNLPKSDIYPLGRKNIESLFSVAVGLLLIGMSGIIGFRSLESLVTVINGGASTLIMGPDIAPWVMGVSGGSALLSLLVSRYQIRIGKKTGHEALVADGQETASDGRIELTTFVGVCGQYLFDAPWIEYPVALFVGYLMVKTGWEIFSRGMSALLQRTIGSDHDLAVRKIVEDMYGVEGVAQLKTFRTGNKVVIIMDVFTRASPAVQLIMKKAMAGHIIDYLRGQGFNEWEFFITPISPPSNFHRRAVLLNRHRRVARSLQDAATMVICDVEHDRVTRATEHPVPYDDSNRREAFQKFLVSKCVAKVIVHDPDDIVDKTTSLLGEIEKIYGSSDQPAVYGLTL